MRTIDDILEMNSIKQQLMSCCASSLGKQRVEDMNLFKDIDDLNESLDKVSEAMNYIRLQGCLPLGGLHDISMSIEKARRDGILDGHELLYIASHFECVNSVQNYLSNSEYQSRYIGELISLLEKDHYLLDEIKRCVLPDGSLDDHASPELFRLRKQIHTLETSMRHRMESLVKESKDYLSIDQMTTKNDRMVLPVKASYKSQLKGLIHGQSATGQTMYIEPEEVVRMNNQLIEVQTLEKEEVNRILFQLSQRVKDDYHYFHYNIELLGELDFIFAKGQYGTLLNCCRPNIDENGTKIMLYEARHPLIDQTKVIANDILLDDKRMLLISGSNTGGKTVTLKTTGLLSYMAMCGLVIPARKATLPFLDYIYVDLGDEQSIEQSLSTFSSHMTRIIDILNKASSKSLVLLDEIASGTDPQEGESLAQAILSRFLEIGCFTLTSTHYGKLKTFAQENNQILMASVGFDMEKMKPTYILKLDTIGQSYAIEIAQMLGLNKRIIEEAKQLKKDSMREHEKLMEKLIKQEEQMNLREEQLSILIQENQKLEKQYQNQFKQLENQKDKILEKAREEANGIVKQTKEDVQKIVDEFKMSQFKQHEILSTKHQLDDKLFKKEDIVVKQSHDLQIGDHVKVIKMNREGDIVEILKNHMIMVSLNGLNVKLHEDEVVYMHPQTKVKKVKKASMKKSSIKKTGSYEINVIGKRYEEAMALVDKFLDDALVLGYPHVRIVHGMGTGALRTGIRKLLDKNKHVVSYRDGGPNEGGLGATLAYFE